MRPEEPTAEDWGHDDCSVCEEARGALDARRAKLAELGERVLEALTTLGDDRSPRQPHRDAVSVAFDIREAARSLGLLPGEDVKP